MGENEENIDEQLEGEELEADLERMREEAMDKAVNNFIKQHVGERVVIKFVGGFYDGKYHTVRKPLKKIMEVAGPPKQSSPGVYTTEVSYETYYLRLIKNTVYYVHDSKLVEFADEHKDELDYRN